MNHIRVQHLVSGLTHIGVIPLVQGVHISMQHFPMFSCTASTEFHMRKCFTLLCANPGPTVSPQCVSTGNQMLHSDVIQPKTNVHSLMRSPLYKKIIEISPRNICPTLFCRDVSKWHLTVYLYI